MLMGRVWSFIGLAVLVAIVAPSSYASRSETNRQNGFHWGSKTLLPHQPPPFFAGNRRPEGLPGISRGKEIQQTLPTDTNGTDPYFVSLFDPERNIPFYSAYKVTPRQAQLIGTYSRKDVKKRWRNPPGVPGLDAAYRKAIKQQPLSRGHMDPLAINSFDKRFMKATYTLTNVVPQYVASNSGPWQIFEAKIRSYAQNVCGNRTRQGTLYLLTGTSEFSLKSDLGRKSVQDSSKELSYATMLLDELTLVVPRTVWTTGCCVWKETSQEFGKVRRAESFAVMSNNVRDKKFLNQTQMSVVKLERHLTAPGSSSVNLFPGDRNCRLPQNNVELP